MKRNIPRENECKRTDARLYDLIDYVYEYANRKKLTRGPFREYYDLEEEWERYPENWEEAVLSMRAAVAVLGDRKKAAAFVRSFKNELTDAELSLVKKWRSHPWFYSAFTVVNEPDEHFVKAERIGDPPSTWPSDEMPESFVIYSPRISDEYRHGSKTFITLLWEGEREGGLEGGVTGEPVFHTYGVIVPFQSIDGNDIRYFADVVQTKNRPSSSYPLKGIPERGSAVSDAIMADPLSFLRLFEVGFSPRIKGPAGDVYFCASVLEVSDIDSLAGEDEWRRAAASAGEKLYDFIEKRNEEAEANRGAVYFGEGKLLEDPRIYISFDTSRIFLSSYTEEGYRRGQVATKSLCLFPEQPQTKASMLIASKAYDMFEYDDEMTVLRHYFEEEPEEENIGEYGNDYGEDYEDEAAPTIDELNAITRRIMDNYNEGVEEDDEGIARAVGVDASMITTLREALVSKIESMGNTGEEPADRFGLSPKAFHRLTNEEIPNVEGVLRMRSPEEIEAEAERKGYDLSQLFSASRAYTFTRWFAAKVIEEGPLPATQSGYVQTKYIREALEKRILPSPEDILEEAHLLREELRPKKEKDWMEFRKLRALMETAQIVVFDGKRFLPGHGTDELVDAPAELYHHLMKVMFTGFEWDALPHLGTIPFLRKLAPFLLYAIRRLSQEAGSEEDTANAAGWFHSDLLFERFVAAAPPLAAEILEDWKSFQEDEEDFSARDAVKAGFEMEFIRNFAERMGLVEIYIGENYFNDMYLRPTPLFSIGFE